MDDANDGGDTDRHEDGQRDVFDPHDATGVLVPGGQQVAAQRRVGRVCQSGEGPKDHVGEQGPERQGLRLLLGLLDLVSRGQGTLFRVHIHVIGESGARGGKLEGIRATEQEVQARGRRDADDQENELDDRPLNVAGGVREGRVGQEGVHEGFAPVTAFAVVATHGPDLRRRQREERRRDNDKREGTPRQGDELASSAATVGASGEGREGDEKRRDEEREDREGGARVCADEADGADEEEYRLRNTAHDRTQPIARTQVGDKSASRDDRDGCQTRHQSGARRVGPLIVHGECVGGHVEQHAADDGRRHDRAARGGQHRDERRQAKHPHGHERQRGHVRGLDNRVVAREQRNEGVPARRIVDVAAAVQLVEAAEGAGILAVQDRVHTVLMERRIPLLDGVRWDRAHHEGQRREDKAHQDRAPRGRTDRGLAPTDRLAHADGLTQGNSPQRKPVVAAAEEAQAPRAGSAEGAHAEDRQHRRGLPLNVESRVGDRQDRDQAKGERGGRTDRDERRASSRPQPHEPR